MPAVSCRPWHAVVQVVKAHIVAVDQHMVEIDPGYKYTQRFFKSELQNVPIYSEVPTPCPPPRPLPSRHVCSCISADAPGHRISWEQRTLHATLFCCSEICRHGHMFLSAPLSQPYSAVHLQSAGCCGEVCPPHSTACWLPLCRCCGAKPHRCTASGGRWRRRTGRGSACQRFIGWATSCT